MKQRYTYPIIVFLIIFSCAAFGRIAGNDFIPSTDDSMYITENKHVQSGFNQESITWAFTTTYFGYWHPLNLISHMLDWKLFGVDASGHHLVSMFLHIGAVIFLFLFLSKTTGDIWLSAFASAFFALHPLRVESVAYAGERKDVLSMFFGMASFLAYASYAESSKLSRYFLCLALFILALMSKPMLITLPFLLILLDYWPLKRWQEKTTEQNFNSKSRLILEKVPFILLSLILSITTLKAHKNFVSFDTLPFLKRIANAIVSYATYPVKTLWPSNLAIYYPLESSLPVATVLISGVILILITIAAIHYMKSIPYFFVGWFWYLGTLIPVIGLITLGTLAMADRYTYLPSVGLAIIMVWGISQVVKNTDIRKKLLFPGGIVVMIILTVLTWHQCGYWKNGILLWSHALQATKDNAFANNNLGVSLVTEGKIEEAIGHYSRAIRLSPSDGQHYNNRGNAYLKLEQYQRAIEDYDQAIRLKPDDAITYYNRANAYYNLHQYQQAIEDYNQAIRLKPDDPKAYNNRGGAYFAQGNYQRGCHDAQMACALGGCIGLEWAKSKGFCR